MKTLISLYIRMRTSMKRNIIMPVCGWTFRIEFKVTMMELKPTIFWFEVGCLIHWFVPILLVLFWAVVFSIVFILLRSNCNILHMCILPSVCVFTGKAGEIVIVLLICPSGGGSFSLCWDMGNSNLPFRKPILKKLLDCKDIKW